MLTTRLCIVRWFAAAVLLSAPVISIAQAPSPAVAELYKQGAQAAAAKNLPEARSDLEKVTQLAPGFELGHSALGTVLLWSGDRAGGIRELEKAMALKPSDSQAALNLANAYLQDGNAERAAAWYAKAVAAQRAAHQKIALSTLEGYASALQQQGRTADAVEVLKGAAAEQPSNAALQDALGSLQAMQKQWGPATESFRRAIVLDPKNATMHLHLAVALHAAGRPGAEAELQRAHALAPDDEEINRQLNAPAAAEETAPAESADELEAAYRAGKTPQAAYRLGLALQRENKPDEAVRYLKIAADAMPGKGEVQTNYGMALCQVQRAADAVPVLKRAVVLEPRNAVAHQDLAVAYVQLSQFNDAVTQLKEAIRLAPDSAALHYNLGLAYKMLDQFDAALPELTKAEQLDEKASEPGYVLGLIFLQQGKYAEAGRELSKSLALNANNGEGWATLGSVENNLNKLPEAADALRKAIEQEPEKSDPHLTLAAVLAKQGNTAEAAAERRKAAELMRAGMNRQRSEVSTRSGEDLLKQNKLDDARAAFEEAVHFDPQNTAAHAGLAAVLERQGHALEAAEERAKAAPAK